MVIEDSPIENAYEFAALGFFVGQCSSLEVLLHICVKQLLHIEDETARIVIGEPRIGDLIDLLKKAARLREFSEPRIAALTKLLTMAGDTNKVRQIVAHKPFFMEPPHMVFHNKITARTKGALFEYRCTAQELHNLGTYTSRTAQCCMNLCLMDGPVEPMFIADVTEHEAWSRSIPLPAIPSPAPQPTSPKQPRQPRASQA